MEQPVFTVALILFALLFGAFVYVCVGWFAHVFLSGSWFRIGPVTQRGDFSIGPIVAEHQTDRVFVLSHVKARHLGDGAYIFRAKLPIIGSTPFPLKGTAILKNERAEVQGRLPASPLAFLGFFLTLWTLLSIQAEPYSLLESLRFVGFGWAIAATMLLVSWPIESYRFRRAFFELRDHLEGSRGESNAP